MGEASKFMDTSMEENMQKLESAAQSTSTVQKIASKESQVAQVSTSEDSDK